MGKLYHYTSASKLIEYILPKMQLRSGYLGEMNDPREKRPFAFGGVNIPLEEIYGDYYTDDTHIDCLYKLGKDIKDRIQVFCFSGMQEEGWNNEMMWAQYADKHKGVCIELDEDLLCQHSLHSKFNFKIENVDYSEKAKRNIYWNKTMSIEENILHFINTQYRDLAFKKSSCWKAEDEKRLIIINEKERVHVPIHQALTGIYLGIDFVNEYLPSIRKQLPRNVRVYRAFYQYFKFERWDLDDPNH